MRNKLGKTVLRKNVEKRCEKTEWFEKKSLRKKRPRTRKNNPEQGKHVQNKEKSLEQRKKGLEQEKKV